MTSRTVSKKRFDIIQPSLIQQLKSILDQYPDDGQILKELIQNAEDANAKVVCFLYDNTCYDADPNTMEHPDLVQFQGPSLYAYNDAIFDDNDWKGIRTICDSFKKDDPIKVGRFGLGFKSVFHMTDFPGIMSGKTVGFVDPHQKYFSDRDGLRTGACWDLSDLDSLGSDLFTPFQDSRLDSAFGTRIAPGYYDGTLFRFPLRTRGSKSKLSDDDYSPDRIKCLFKQFEIDAYMCLLFLKSLEKIELYERDMFDQEPRLIFKVEISGSCLNDIRVKREHFLRQLRTGKWLPEPLTMTYKAVIESSNSLGECERQQWLVTNYNAGGKHCHTVRSLCGEKALSYLPWVAVAMPLNDHDVEQNPQGHVFCFLPLPLEKKSVTGLPIHVNGYFAVSSNRRHLKWPSADQSDKELSDRSLLWNQAMLTEAVPLAFVELISQAVIFRVDHKHIYAAIPDISKVDHKWMSMVDQFITKVIDVAFLYTKACGGKYVSKHEALFSVLGEDEFPDIINWVLEHARQPVVTVPFHVKRAVERFSLQYVSPKRLRESFRFVQQNNDLSALPEEHRLKILKYAIQDKRYSQLIGLDLLPLANGEFITFDSRGSTPVYLPSADHPATLLPGLEDRFVRTSPSVHGLFGRVEELARSGRTHVALLNSQHVAKLLRNVLPAWTADIVQWESYPKWLSLDWLKMLWLYLIKNFPDNLSAVENLHILPLRVCVKNAWYLQRLRRNSTVVFKDPSSTILNPSTLRVLQKLGATVADEVPPFVNKHRQIDLYRNLPDIPGVLKTLSSLGGHVRGRMKGMSQKLILDFCSDIAKGDTYTLKIHKSLLRSLPMFCVSGNTRASEHGLASIEEIEIIAPLEAMPVAVNQPMLLVTDSDSLHLCKILGVEPLPVHKVITDHVFPSITKYSFKERDDLIEFIFTRLTHVVQSNETFKADLQRARIVTRSDGKLVTASEVFDRQDLSLFRLFEGQNVFPRVGVCTRSDIVPHLRSLGLKTATHVSSFDIIGVAKNVKTSAFGKSKANELLTFLHSRRPKLEKSTMCTLKDELANISWIPVKKRPETNPRYLKWFGTDMQFAKPSSLVDCSYADIAGSVKPIADVQKPSTFAMLSTSTVTLEDVLVQLRNVIAAMVEERKRCPNMCVFSTPEPIKRICFAIYHDLQKQILHDQTLTTYIHVQKALQDKTCVLLEERSTFVNARLVSFSKDDDLPPFRHSLPPDINRHYSILMSSLGVVKKFDAHEYNAVLTEMKVQHGDDPLDEDMIGLARKLARLLVQSLTAENEDVTREVFLPNNSRILKPSTELCFNDCPWIKDSDMPFVDADIPYDVADALGVMSKRAKTLSNHSFGIPFGQREKLTSRIKRILDGYPCDIDIMKELLQNADDAQATEIHFILDPRHHSTERVFEECWKPLQGPALCVYNNRPFTEADIEGIQSLGEGNKGEDPTKTGQYGVGFNAVYHITDAPSFLTCDPVSGERLCVFDPNCLYVPSATEHWPGRCYKDIPTLKQKFPSVFGCYMEDWFPSNNGTMFRFPLRNESMAQTSNIKNTCLTVDDLREMLASFEKDAGLSLLFLNNVRTIAISEVNEKTNAISATVVVKAEKDNLANRNEFNKYTKRMAAKVKSGDLELWDIEPKDVIYEMSVEASTKRKMQWLIVQRIGFHGHFEIPQKLQNAIHRHEIGLLPRGGVAMRLDPHNVMPHYPSVRNRVFCFLPLPQKTSLPVHINGHFALDHEARRDIWKTNDGDAKTEWNRMMMEHVVAPAYVSLVNEFRVGIVCKRTLLPLRDLDSLRVYQRLFPITNENCRFIDVVRRFYDIMADETNHSLPVVRPAEQNLYQVAWFSPIGDGQRRAYFNDLRNAFPSIQTSYIGKETRKDEVLRDILLKCNFNLIWEPFSLLHAEFHRSNVKTHLTNPLSVLEFFQTHQVMGVTIRDVMDILKYCSNSEEFLASLEGVSLLLTDDNYIRTFSGTNPVYLSRFSSLVPENASEFVHKILIDSVFDIQRDLDAAVFKQFTALSFERMLSREHELWGKRQWDWHVDNPTETWIKKLWQFIKKESTSQSGISLIQSLNQWCFIPACRYDEYSPKAMPEVRTGRTLVHDHKRMSHYQMTLGAPKESCITTRFLVQLSRNKAVVIMEDDCTKETLTQCLKILGIPFLLDKFVPKGLHTFFSSLNKPCDILTALEEQAKIQSLEGKLSRKKCNLLLVYFCKCLTVADQSIRRRLKQLPFFLTVHNALVSLRNRQVFVLPNSIPTSGMHVWETTGIVFLEDNIHLKDVWSFLQIPTISCSEVYRNYILKDFHLMSQEEQMKHLVFLRDFILINPKQPDTIAMIHDMRTIKFIPSEDGQLKTADTFYDHEEEVFREMLESHCLVPPLFSKLRPLLLKIGLRNEVTEDEFVEYANRVAHHIDDIEDKLRKAEVLVHYLMSREYPPKTLLSRVKKIPFVPRQILAEKYIYLHIQYALDKEQSNLYTQLDGAVMTYENECTDINSMLVWSSAPLLPPWVCFRKHNAKVLGVHLQPTIHQVIAHCYNLCRKLNVQKRSNPKLAWDNGMLLEVMTAVYSYLTSRLGDLNDWDKKNLEELPLVLVEDGSLFIHARQIVEDIRTSEAIKPFMFKLPSEIAQFKALFFELGASKEISAKVYAMILLDIKQQSEGEQLHVNEMLTCTRALRGLLSCTYETLEGSNFKHALFLPTQDKTLVESKDCVVMDDNHLYRRIKQGFNQPIVLHDVDAEFTRLTKYLLKLPTRYRPRLLSNVVKSRYEHIGVLTLSANSDNEVVKGFYHRIKSVLFRQSLIRLARHAQAEDSNALDMSSLDQLKLDFENAVVYEAESVQSFCEDESGSRICGSEQKNNCFVHRAEHSFMVVYIKSSATVEDVLRFLPTQLNACLANVFGSLTLIVRDLLDPKTPTSAFSQLMNENDIRSIDEIDERNSVTTPQLGMYIPVNEHHFLEQDYVNFEIGEYVGYEIEDPSLQNEDGEPTYIYAIICNEIDAGSHPTHFYKRYLIDIGDRQIEAYAIDLYKFHRPTNLQSAELCVTPADFFFDVDKIKGDILEQINDASKMSNEDRNKVFRRLILRWHPDKNLGNEEMCTKIFQYITQVLEDLQSKQNNGSVIHSSRWFSRGSGYRRQREEWRSEDRSNTSFSQSFARPNPQPIVARRWYRQAGEDFRASSLDFGRRVASENASYVWACYKCHQSSEKALKAAQFAVDSNMKENTHNLPSIACTISTRGDCDSRLYTSAMELQTLLGNPNMMRYPDMASRNIPSDIFTLSMATRARGLSLVILEVVAEFLGNHGVTGI